MKHLTILCVVALAVALLQAPAQAGRHARCAARRTTVVVAAAAVARRPVVVAAAPVVAARPAPAVVALPDLTVVAVAAEGDVLTVVVQNIGRAACPATHLEVALRRGADRAVVAKQTLQVLPLAVGQTMRMRLRSAPLDDVEATATADSAHEVTEMNELNNNRVITIAPLPVPPPVLEAEAVWSQSVNPEDATDK